MKTNVKTKVNKIKTHEGAPAMRTSKEMELRRSVMSCLLWEKEFYEDGVSISQRISSLVPQVDAKIVSDIAIEARSKMNLRHVPLLLARELARDSKRSVGLVSDLLYTIIQRPDELAEFLSIYWLEGKCPLASQVKKGLARAFTKFDEYQLAKYNRNNDIKLRDVLFLCHAKPKDKEQEILWKKLVENELETPDTWEVNLSGGKDKKETWERMIEENKLGAFAVLRNLRNMQDVNVKDSLIKSAIKNMNTGRILPFRFIAAAKYAPNFEQNLEEKMFESLKGKKKLEGETIVLVDVSGSMSYELSHKSDMNRIDAACGLAMCIRELCDDVKVYSFSEDVVSVPNRRGFALRDSIENSQDHSSTYLGMAVKTVKEKNENARLIVITDEQSHDQVVAPKKGRNYMINVASNENGVGYGKWIHVDGFSEAIVDYIFAYENFD